MSDNNMVLQVMMLGGRRCGKTSILAAMQSCFESVCESSKLTLVQNSRDTRRTLAKKLNELKEYFTRPGGKTFIPDSNPTLEKTIYSFAFAVSEEGKNTEKIPVSFVDYPGEWLVVGSDGYDKHIDELENDMAQSQVLIITIDTPHMMEEDGHFNEQRNLCDYIANTLVDLLSNNESQEKKLVLFIPLKCERYHKDKRMNDVCEKTQEVYRKLIRFLEGSPGLYEVAITPIFTMGNAEFDRFGWDDETNYIKLNEYGTPDESRYRLVDKRVYEPKLCEQPLLYLMAYLMHMASEEKGGGDGGVFGTLMKKIYTWLSNGLDAATYQHLKEIIARQMHKQLFVEENGYKILQDPLDLLQY